MSFITAAHELKEPRARPLGALAAPGDLPSPLERLHRALARATARERPGGGPGWGVLRDSLEAGEDSASDDAEDFDSAAPLRTWACRSPSPRPSLLDGGLEDARCDAPRVSQARPLGAPQPAEPDSRVIAVVRPGERLWPGLSMEVSVLSCGPLCQVSAETERAEILAVNLAEGTYKVCLPRTGRTKVLRAMSQHLLAESTETVGGSRRVGRC